MKWNTLAFHESHLWLGLGQKDGNHTGACMEESGEVMSLDLERRSGAAPQSSECLLWLSAALITFLDTTLALQKSLKHTYSPKTHKHIPHCVTPPFSFKSAGFSRRILTPQSCSGSRTTLVDHSPFFVCVYGSGIPVCRQIPGGGVVVKESVKVEMTVNKLSRIKIIRGRERVDLEDWKCSAVNCLDASWPFHFCSADTQNIHDTQWSAQWWICFFIRFIHLSQI